MSVDDKTEIMHIVELLRGAVETGEFQSLFDNYADDVFNGFGTNSDEIFINQDEAKRNFDKQSNQQNVDNIKIKFVLDHNIVNFLNQSAAFGMNYGHIIVTYPEKEIILKTRETLIFRRLNNHWKLCHYHLSCPFTGAETGIPLPKFEQISENISNWLKKLEIDKFEERDQRKRKELIEYLQKAKALIDT